MRPLLSLVFLSIITVAAQNPDKIKQDSMRVSQLYNQGQLKKAFILAEKTYHKATKILGNNHPRTLVLMSNLAILYESQENYDKAAILYHQCLKLRRKNLGKQHSDTLASMSHLATFYRNQGQYKKAADLQSECLQLMQVKLGQNHPYTLISMRNLATIYYFQGQYTKAEPLYTECTKLMQIKLGKDHPQTLSAMANLAILYKSQGKYKKAESLYLETLDLTSKKLGKDHPNTLNTVNNLATLYVTQGRYEEAKSLYLQTIKLMEVKFGRTHPETLTCMNNLAGLFESQGKYNQAERLYLQSFQLLKKKLGQGHIRTLISMDNLATLYKAKGKYDKAEPIYLQCLQLMQTQLEKDHPRTIAARNNLAELYENQGKYDKAEQLYTLCLKQRERKLGKDHHDTLVSLRNLASLYYYQKKYAKAETLYQKCLRQMQVKLGKSHHDTLTSLNNLAALYYHQGKYQKSIDLQGFLLMKDKLGESHPDTLTAMNNLAALYEKQEKYSKAEYLYMRCLKLRKKALGIDHPDTIASVNNLLWLFCKMGEYAKAQNISRQRLLNINQYFSSLFPGCSRDVQRYFLLEQKFIENTSLSVYLKLKNNESAKNFVHFSLTRKAFLLFIASQMQDLNIADESPEVQSKFRELNTKKRLLSHLLLNATVATRHKQLQLKESLEYLEQELGTQSSRLRRNFQKLTVDDIQQSLQDNEAIVDFLIFDKVDFSNMNYISRYLAAAIIYNDKITLVPIGKFAAIESALSKYRKTMSFRNKHLYSKKLVQQLYQLIWKPITEKLSHKISRITIVPDGKLHILPFASLCDNNGKYLIEKVDIQTCSSLRRMVIDRSKVKKPEKVIIFANPNYDMKIDAGKNFGMYFGSLPGTAVESNGIQKILKNKNIPYQSYRGSKATKEQLINIKNPRILHLATHGFFLGTPTKTQQERGVNIPNFKRIKTPSYQISTNKKDKMKNLFDPFIYCGLAFTGANKSSSQISIILGREVSNLALWKTELVVLSACATGLGTTKDVTSEGKIFQSEEVLSLRRAFEEAGTRAVLSTMWNANDKATQKFMPMFYQYYLNKVPPQKALKAVQLEFLKDPEYSHPYYWANFVIYGTDKHFPHHTKKIKFNLITNTESFLFYTLILLCSLFVVAVYQFIHTNKVKKSKLEEQRTVRREKRKPYQ